MPEQDLTEEEHGVADADLRLFDEVAEAASRKAEQELATAIEAAKVAQAAIRTAAREWMRVRIARIRQHRPPMQEMLASDFEDSLRELERAKANIWPV